MVTFFTIFVVLIAINVALLVHSSIVLNRRKDPRSQATTEQPAIKIYPLNWWPAYKKAV